MQASSADLFNFPVRLLMSLFKRLVVKVETRMLDERNGSVPLQDISQKWENQAWVWVVFCAIIWAGALAFFSYQLDIPKGWVTTAENYHQEFPYHWVLPKFRAVFIVTMVALLLGAAGFFGNIQKAAAERIAMRDKKAELEVREREQRAVAVAKVDQQNAQAYAELSQFRRDLFAMREYLLRNMENQIRDALIDGRRRKLALEWAPEYSEEGVHEMIRHNIRRSGIPEFGILRRSTDHTVLEVLGDRSCLPPEPSEELIARRNLPEVKRLLISIN